MLENTVHSPLQYALQNKYYKQICTQIKIIRTHYGHCHREYFTLEDVLQSLYLQPWWETRGYIAGFQISVTVDKDIYNIDISDSTPDCNYKHLCSWLINKPLHEQTPETWEKIATVCPYYFTT